MGNIPRRELQ